MTLRMLTVTLLSGGVTFLLFWSMTVLIATPEIEIKPQPSPIGIGWIDEVRTPAPPLPKPDPLPKKPELAPSPQVDPFHPGRTAGPGLGIGPGTPIQGPGIGEEGFQLIRPSGDVVPLVRVPPRYPARALARGIQGRVLVEFTVDPAGRVRDAQVIAAEPENVFEEAALEAVRQWRYEPRVEDGRALSRSGVRIAIPFVVGQGEG